MANTISALNDEVTQKVSNQQFYSHGEFERQFHSASVPLFRNSLLIHGLDYGNENYSGGHRPTHYMDVTTSSDNRFKESRVRLLDPTKHKCLVHDGPENIGKDIAGEDMKYYLLAALVVGDVIDHLLSGDAGVDLGRSLDLMTNKRDIVFSPVANYFKKIAPKGVISIVDTGDLVNRLDSEYTSISYKWNKIFSGRVNEFYDRLANKLENTLKALYSSDHAADLSDGDRKYVAIIMEDFVRTIRARKNDGARPKDKDLMELVDFEYKRVRERILAGNFPPIDINLILPSSSLTIIESKNALYWDYVRDIMASGDYDAAIVKVADHRDNVSRLGPNLPHMISQFRKENAVISLGAESVRYKRGRLPYGDLNNMLRFLVETLEKSLLKNRDDLEIAVSDNTQYRLAFKKLDYMFMHMPEFRKILGMPPSEISLVKDIVGTVKSAKLVSSAIKRVRGEAE